MTFIDFLLDKLALLIDQLRRPERETPETERSQGETSDGTAVSSDIPVPPFARIFIISFAFIFLGKSVSLLSAAKGILSVCAVICNILSTFVAIISFCVSIRLLIPLIIVFILVYATMTYQRHGIQRLDGQNGSAPTIYTGDGQNGSAPTIYTGESSQQSHCFCPSRSKLRGAACSFAKVICCCGVCKNRQRFPRE